MKTILTAIEEAMAEATKNNIEPKYATFGPVKYGQLKEELGKHKLYLDQIAPDYFLQVNGMIIFMGTNPGITISATSPKPA